MTGTAVQLTSASLEADQIVVRAARANADSVYFGLAGVTSTDGFELGPGETFVFDNELRAGEVPYDVRPSDLYFDGTSGDKVSWLAWVR